MEPRGNMSMVTAFFALAVIAGLTLAVYQSIDTKKNAMVSTLEKADPEAVIDEGLVFAKTLFQESGCLQRRFNKRMNDLKPVRTTTVTVDGRPYSVYFGPVSSSLETFPSTSEDFKETPADSTYVEINFKLLNTRFRAWAQLGNLCAPAAAPAPAAVSQPQPAPKI